MVDLTSLLKRVRAASGPDRELDLDIARALAPALKWTKVDERNVNWYKPTPHWPCFTQSIDAAVALVERVGYVIHTIHRSKSGLWSVTLEPGGESEGLRLLPLAILAALLSALE